jgi:hypothetical protein
MTPFTTRRPPIAARLCRRSSTGKAQARLNTASARALASYPDTRAASEWLVVPVGARLTRPDLGLSNPPSHNSQRPPQHGHWSTGVGGSSAGVREASGEETAFQVRSVVPRPLWG